MKLIISLFSTFVFLNIYAESDNLKDSSIFYLPVCKNNYSLQCMGCNDANSIYYSRGMFILRKCSINKPISLNNAYSSDTLYVLYYMKFLGFGSFQEKVLFTERIHSLVDGMEGVDLKSKNVVSFRTPFWYKRKTNVVLRKNKVSEKFGGFLNFALYSIKLEHESQAKEKELYIPNVSNKCGKIFEIKKVIIYEITDIISFSPVGTQLLSATSTNTL